MNDMKRMFSLTAVVAWLLCQDWYAAPHQMSAWIAPNMFLEYIHGVLAILCVGVTVEERNEYIETLASLYFAIVRSGEMHQFYPPVGNNDVFSMMLQYFTKEMMAFARVQNQLLVKYIYNDDAVAASYYKNAAPINLCKVTPAKSAELAKIRSKLRINEALKNADNERDTGAATKKRSGDRSIECKHCATSVQMGRKMWHEHHKSCPKKALWKPK